MICIVETEPMRRKHGLLGGLWHKLSLAFAARKDTSPSRLYPDELSDHLKRDLGFLDGRS